MTFKDLRDAIFELRLVLGDAVSLATSFHRSSVRAKELKQVAVQKNLSTKHIPRFFEVRFTEYSYDLLDSVLGNLEGILHYLGDPRFDEDARSKAQR